MYIAKQNDLICACGTTYDEVDNFMKSACASDYSIEKTDIEYVLYNGTYFTKAEFAQKEAERLAHLNLTAADVERGLYQALGLDFDDVVAKVEKIKPEGLDIKALKIELKANNFYRGNPYIDTIGSLLGLSSKQLDDFFETNDYKKLNASEVIIDD